MRLPGRSTTRSFRTLTPIAGQTRKQVLGGKKGFTLIELMIVISIIGILGTIAIPNYLAYRQKARILDVTNNLKFFEKAFLNYFLNVGQYPDDSHIVLPDLPRMASYISPERWGKVTPLGGTYNWEGPNAYPYAGIALFEVTAPNEELVMLDYSVDDGNLSQGKFRRTPNGRYTYILKE